MKLLVLDEEAMPAEPRTVCEDDARAVWIRDLDVRDDLVGASAHADRNALGYRRRARIVDVTVARRLLAGPLDSKNLLSAPVIERKHEVLVRLVEPGLDQRLELVGMLLRQIRRLGAVHVDVIELPFVLVEVALAGQRRMQCARLPPVFPHAARA